MASHLDYDPTSPLVQADPYPYYARLREFASVHWNQHLRVWVVSRHVDVVDVLRDSRLSSNYLGSLEGDDVRRRNLDHSWRAMLFMDAPEHARLRRVVTKSFNAALIDNLALYARAVAIELLESTRGRDEFDCIAELAAPLAWRVLARALEVPDRDLGAIVEQAHDLSTLVDWTPRTEVLVGVADRAMELGPYFLELVRRRRREPGDGLISALVEQAKHHNIRYLDIVSTVILFLAAGQATSTHMIGNGVLALLRDPQALEACRSGRYSMLQIVDELLRFDAPVQVTPRTAVVDFKIGGETIRRGDVVLALLGSANRDSSVFVEPDQLDPGRRTGPALSFGGGPHFCIGAALARQIGAVVFDELLHRYPRLRLAPQSLEWRPNVTQRGLTALLVKP